MKRILVFLTAVILCMMLAGTALADKYPVFDFDRKTVILNSGYDMPILGLGMFSLSDSEAENSTYWALKAGFRLIDTARIYGNEAAVGRGLRRAIMSLGRRSSSPPRCGQAISEMAMQLSTLP